jgi:hypothetical protein
MKKDGKMLGVQRKFQREAYTDYCPAISSSSKKKKKKKKKKKNGKGRRRRRRC